MHIANIENEDAREFDEFDVEWLIRQFQSAKKIRPRPQIPVAELPLAVAVTGFSRFRPNTIFCDLERIPMEKVIAQMKARGS